MNQQRFSRRDFCGYSAVGAAGMAALLPNPRARAAQPGARASGEGESLGLDRFGGLQSVRFKATGFFRVEKADRWWFVTPEGSAFLSFGLNHPSEEYLTQDYNVEFWKQRFGVEEVSDPGFREGFVKKVMADLSAFGMNSIGTHARKEHFGKLSVPYVQGLFFVRTPYWMEPARDKFVDVFAPGFERQCDRIVSRVVAPKRDDPFLIGYTFTDCPILTDRDADAHGQVAWGRAQPDMPTWPRVLRNLGPEAPGKRVFVGVLRDRYPDIVGVNAVYKTKFSSFDDLLEARDWCPVVKSDDVDDADDNRAFLIKIMNRYYTVACAAIRRADTHHLIFGDILNAQTTTPDEIVTLVSRYTDLIAYQSYSGYDEHRAILDRWSRLSAKPLYHADTSFAVPYKEMPAPIGALCRDQETRARRFLDSASRALSRSDVIGWNWCGWVDSWGAWKPERQHTGLQDPFGRYHHPVPETMQRFGRKLYDYGLGKPADKS